MASARLLSKPLALGSFFLLFSIGSAHSQVASSDAAPGEDTLSMLSPKPLAQRSFRDGPTREYHDLPIAGWMLKPSLLIGAVYDDNLFQSSAYRVGAVGLHLRPSLVAGRSNGIHKTTVYLDGDFRIYPDRDGGDTINGRIGFNHVWEARRDLVLRGGFEYARHTDQYNNGFVVGPFGAVLGTLAAPLRYNQYAGNISGIKSFDRFFVGIGGAAIGTTYDTFYTTLGPQSLSGRDNIATAVTGRFGYRVTPLLYTYVEATGNFRDFNDTTFNSEGYRVAGGVGTDRIGLMRGEVFGGYQRQFYYYPLFPSAESPVVGTRLFWYPTRAITASLTVDETYQDASIATVGNRFGSAARVISALGTIGYSMSRSWSASLSSGYSDVSYITGGRHDTRWVAASRVNYEIFRNLAATFEYSFTNVASNAIGGGFTRNAFTLGGTYKY